MKRFLDEREVEAEFGLRVRTLQRWRSSGGGPRFCKANRSVLYAVEDIESFLTERKHSPTSEYPTRRRGRSN